jgi:vacuolar-type H+-ATPase subunit D/Vma8
MTALDTVLEQLAAAKEEHAQLTVQYRVLTLDRDGLWKRFEKLEAENAALRKEAESGAAVQALNAIAKLCGCEQWEYPGQLVRDVERLRAESAAKDAGFAVLAEKAAADSAANQKAVLDLEVQLASAEGMIERLRAENAELRGQLLAPCAPKTAKDET